MPSASGIRAGKAFVEIGANLKGLEAGLRKAQAKIKAFGGAAGNLGGKFLRSGGALAAGLAVPLTIFSKFDDQMRAVQAVTGATGDQFAMLTEEAKRLGRTTSFTASQVAGAMAELGRAGFTPQQILDSSEDILALARATGTDLPRAAEIGGAALRAFGLEASDMGRVSDVLSSAANGSAQTLEDLYEAFKPAAPLAKQAGTSIEDLSAAIGLLANNGIKGSLAGNAIGRAYKNLSTTAKQNELGQIGIDAVDAQGNLRPLVDILRDLNVATGSFGSAQKLALFDSLFGRGAAAAAVLAENTDAFDELNKSIESSAGFAVATAEKMDDGIGGSFRKLLSAAEGVAIALGEGLEGPIGRVADKVTELLGPVTEWVKQNARLIGLLAGVAAGLLAAGAVLTAVGVAAFGASAAFGALATVVGIVLSPLGVVVAVLALVLKYTGAGGAAIDYLRGKFASLGPIVESTIGGVRDALAGGDLKLAAQVAWNGVKLAWLEGTQEIRETFTNVLTAMRLAMVEALATMSRLWIGFSTGLQNVWEKTQNAVAKGWTYVLAVFDDGIDVEAANAQLEKQSQARLKAIADRAESQLREVNDKEDARTKAAFDLQREKFEAQREALVKAQADLDKSLAEAKAARESKGDDALKTAEDAGGTLAASIQAAVAGIPESVARSGASSVGTFSGAQARAFRTAGETAMAAAVKATAETNKSIDKNTKRIADRAESSKGLVFS